MTENTSTVLITGASSGIGCELAKLFAKDHHNLVLIARSGPKLAQFADELQRHFGVSVKPIALDLATPTAPQLLFDQLRRDGIGVHILVNNAGYGMLGEFAALPLEESLGERPQFPQPQRAVGIHGPPQRSQLALPPDSSVDRIA